MAITGDDLSKTLAWLKQRRLERIAAGIDLPDDFEEPPEFTAEDEAILDRIWDRLGEENRNPTISGTMTDEEMREFFGINDEPRRHSCKS